MPTRRETREWMVQFLYQMDMNPSEKLDEAFQRFWRERHVSKAGRTFMEAMVRGVLENRTTIDDTLARYAENWDLGRMGVIDRNVMRLAVYEMLYCADIPPVVSINEAVDLAQYFSSRESGKFVNGILDRVLRDLQRPARG